MQASLQRASRLQGQARHKHAPPGCCSCSSLPQQTPLLKRPRLRRLKLHPELNRSIGGAAASSQRCKPSAFAKRTGMHQINHHRGPNQRIRFNLINWEFNWGPSINFEADIVVLQICNLASNHACALAYSVTISDGYHSLQRTPSTSSCSLNPKAWVEV
eukprot:1136622-Pelagomonas_calceolata.AAC.2